jgi:hypothetical protein
MTLFDASAPHIPSTYAAVRFVKSGHFRSALAHFRTCSIATLLALLLIGCASQPRTVGPFGYTFAMGQFVDGRAQDEAAADDALMAVAPFRIEQFWQSWQRVVQRGLFGSPPAVLNVTLLDYASTQSGRAYAVSVLMQLEGRLPNVRPGTPGTLLFATEARCSAVRTPGFELDEIGQQVWREGSLRSLTLRERALTLQQKAMDACVSELAENVGNQLVAGSR